MAEVWTGFHLYGENAEGKPKWLSFPCQAKGSDETERCKISINGQRNGSGATWSCAGADKAGPIDAPTVSPSIHCRGVCHFFIEGGRFRYTDDHQGRRDG